MNSFPRGFRGEKLLISVHQRSSVVETLDLFFLWTRSVWEVEEVNKW